MIESSRGLQRLQQPAALSISLEYYSGYGPGVVLVYWEVRFSMKWSAQNFIAIGKVIDYTRILSSKTVDYASRYLGMKV